MPVKSKRVNLSIHPNTIRRIIDVGRQNRLQERDGSLKITAICTKIVYFFLDLYKDPDVLSYLEKNGGTLFDLILRAIQKLVKPDEND